MLFNKEELESRYIADELLKLTKHEGITVVKVTIIPPRPDSIMPVNYTIYDFWLDDKFTLGQYYSEDDGKWYTDTRSNCKENKLLTDMMNRYFPDGRVTKDSVKTLPSSDYYKSERSKVGLNFSKIVRNCFSSISKNDPKDYKYMDRLMKLDSDIYNIFKKDNKIYSIPREDPGRAELIATYNSEESVDPLRIVSSRVKYGDDSKEYRDYGKELEFIIKDYFYDIPTEEDLLKSDKTYQNGDGSFHEFKYFNFSEKVKLNFSWTLMNKRYKNQAKFELCADEVNCGINDHPNYYVFEVKAGSKDTNKESGNDRAIYVKDIIDHLVESHEMGSEYAKSHMKDFDECLSGFYLQELKGNENNGDYDKMYKLDNTTADHGETFYKYGIIRHMAKDYPGHSDDGFHYLCMSLAGGNKVVNLDPARLVFDVGYIKSDKKLANFSNMSYRERLIRILIRRNPDLNYSDSELSENGVTRDELNEYKNTHPELLDTSDDDSLANFSEKAELIFGKFPCTTCIVDKALGNIEGWECTSGGDSGEDYCSYTKTEGQNRGEVRVKINGDQLEVTYYLYRTPKENTYLHGYDKNVRPYMKPFSNTLSIPEGGTWEDIDYSHMHDNIKKIDKYLKKYGSEYMGDTINIDNFSKVFRKCLNKIRSI